MPLHHWSHQCYMDLVHLLLLGRSTLEDALVAKVSGGLDLYIQLSIIANEVTSSINQKDNYNIFPYVWKI